MASTSSFGEIQHHLKEACVAYKNLTSILIEFGYQSLVEDADVTNAADCLDAVMKVIETMEEIAEEEDLNETDPLLRDIMQEVSGDLIVGHRPQRQPHFTEQIRTVQDQLLGGISKNRLRASLGRQNQMNTPTSPNTSGMTSLSQIIADIAAHQLSFRQPQYQSPVRRLNRADTITQLNQVLGNIDPNMLKEAVQYHLSKNMLDRQRLPISNYSIPREYIAPSTSATPNTSLNVEDLNLSL